MTTSGNSKEFVMKVLLVGYKNPAFWAVTDYIEMALIEMGHQVAFFDYRSYGIPGRFRERFQALESWDRRTINQRLRAKIQQFRPDLFLVNGGYTLEPETIHAARRGGAMTANWFADYPLLFERYLILAPHYDHFFTSGTDALARHRQAGNDRGHWLPFACLPDLHRPVPLEKADRERYHSDVTFVGTAYPERIALLEKLTEFNLVVLGPGWGRLSADHPLRPFVRGAAIRTEEWLKVISGTKIAINFMGSSGFPIDPKTVTMANSRCFEFLGCGAFQLVDAKKDVRRLFVSGRELVWFENADDAASLIRHYLKASTERQAIARRAREAAERTHTYRHRLTELIEVCGK